jgi:hypothetical protein
MNLLPESISVLMSVVAVFERAELNVANLLQRALKESE